MERETQRDKKNYRQLHKKKENSTNSKVREESDSAANTVRRVSARDARYPSHANSILQFSMTVGLGLVSDCGDGLSLGSLFGLGFNLVWDLGWTGFDFSLGLGFALSLD